MLKRITKVLGFVAVTGFFGVTEAQTTFTWNPAGPIYTAGRIRNIIIDKNDPSGNTMYAGSTSSGIFKTTNGGTDWAPLDDQSLIRNISYLAQDKDGNIWVSTGEGFLRWGQKAKAQRGTGLYKLVNNKLVQVKDSNSVGAVITRVACDPNNSQRMALATNKGIIVTTDGWASSTTFSGAALPSLPTGTLANYVSGQDVKFSGGGILYASAGSEIGYNGSAYASVFSKVYRWDYGMTTASDITPNNSILPDIKYGRIELAIAPSNSNVIYASCAAKNTTDPESKTPGTQTSAMLKAFFVSDDGGSNWLLIKQGYSGLDPLYDSQFGTVASGDYAHVITVHPENPNFVFYGGYNFYIFVRQSGTSNGSWTQLGFSFLKNYPYYLHENIHDIKVFPGGFPIKAYFVTDAGIYRTIDFTQSIISFQPFYKGLVTGQFNSVSIERFPIGANTGTAGIATQSVTPYSGFIGGTGGNGLTYYSGTSSLVTQESNYLTGDVYNAEYSKILNGAAIVTTGNGKIYRSANAKNSPPTAIDVNVYTGSLSKVAPTASDFNNVGFSTGTPFKLWENYGQLSFTPDSVIFYNDTLRFQYSMTGISTLTTQTNFTFSAARPSLNALIDSIVIRTGTVVLPVSGQYSSTPDAFQGNDLKDITIKLSNNYIGGNTITVPPIIQVTGPTSTLTPPGVTLNPILGLDNISVTFNSPPFVNKTTPSFPSSGNIVVSDAAAYYRVFATVFYKYKAGDVINVIDNNISTKTTTYTASLPTDLRWTRSYTNGQLDPQGPKTGTNSPSVVNTKTNPVLKIRSSRSARLAMILNMSSITSNAGVSSGGNDYAIVVSKSPLNLNDPLNLVRVSQNGCLKDNSAGVPTNSTISIPGKPIILEWSKKGTEIYYATDDKKLYRVSHITDIMDLSPSCYSGKFYTDIFKYTSPISSNSVNPVSPYRTTLIGQFTKPVTSISTSKDGKTLVITFNKRTGGGASDTLIMTNTNDASVSDVSNIGWQKKENAAITSSVGSTYCTLMENLDNKKVFLGTDNGMFYTSDITQSTPDWKNMDVLSDANGMLPKVQIFDIKQQTMDSWDCYNAGQIYVATNGRGIWTTSSYLRPFFVDVNNIEKPLAENELSIFPNPTSNELNLRFEGFDGETATVQVMDISGRMVSSENLGKLSPGEVTHKMDVSNLTTGVYIVNVHSSSGKKRVAKLIVTK